MSITKEKILDEFIDKETAIEMLECSKRKFTSIISDYKIKTDIIGQFEYYKLSDIEKIIKEVNDFFNIHYSLSYIVESFGYHFLNKYKIKSIEIPRKYKGILTKTRKEFKGANKCYVKADIDELKQEFEDINSKYLDKKDTFKMLETTQDFITNIVSEFNIRTITKGKLYYNIEDLQMAMKEVEKFHEEHYPSQYVYENIYSKYEVEKNNVKQVMIPSHYRGILREKYNLGNISIFYRKDDIDNMSSKYALTGEDKFIDRKTLLEIFEIESDRFVLKPVVEAFDIETMMLKDNSIVYKLKDVERAVEEVKNFFDTYYTQKQVDEIIGFSVIYSHKIESVYAPKHYRGILNKTYSTKGIKKVYHKSDIDTLVENKLNKKRLAEEKKEKARIISDAIANEYLNTKDTLKRLSWINDYRLLKTFRDENQLRYIAKSNTYYYNIEDIENIIKKRKEFFEEYVPVASKECSAYFEKYNTTYKVHSNRLKKHEIPIYCHGLTKKYGINYATHGAVKRSDIKEYLKFYEDRMSSIIYTDKVGQNSFETFIIRLENYSKWKGFEEKSPYTRDKFLDFVYKNLDDDYTKSTIDMKIKRYITLGTTIRDILDRYDVDEIYLLTHSQINLYMNTIAFKTTKINLYDFLKQVNMDLRKLGLGNTLKFNFDKIKNPNQLSISPEQQLNNIQKNLYNFEVYAKVFNYLIDIDYHIDKVIEELESKNSVVHASVWLYTMLHLNNAWRNSDCNRFPELIIKDLIEEYEIKDIKWFNKNRLTLPQSKAVIFRVRQWEMRISKTKMKGVFFCSDELAPSFATAVIILHLYKYSSDIVNKDEHNDNKLIMNFGNSTDINSNMTKKFFKGVNIKGFRFSSLKFNRTIMTYLYFIANTSGDNKALIYAQELRRHVNIKNTTHYVNFDIEKIESLSKQLFQRGEFGYIPALLSQKVLGNGETGSFEEMTNQIIQINAVFGDVQEMNNTARFLNRIRSERQNVIDMISEKSFKECQEDLTNIFTGNLPSKCGSDIQCLFSKQGCQMPNLDDEDKDNCSCFDCPYHIPSIYALTQLCNNLIDNCKDYLGLPRDVELKDFKKYLLENPNTIPHLSKKSKMKLGLKIQRRRVLLAEAIQKYGYEYVYRCLDIERDTFKFISDLIKLDFYETYPQLKITHN